MKTMKYLGCLLALVFAGASAFAAQWFTLSSGGNWAQGQAPTWSGDWAEINNWDGVTFTAENAQPVASKDSKITTTVKFTAMDPADLQEQGVPQGAKAGLTVVETSEGEFSFYGIVSGAWALLDIRPLTAVTIESPVTVSVELKKVAGSPIVVYTVGDESTTGASIASNTEIQTVEYRGKCELKNDLVGETWFNPVAIVTTGLPTGVDSVQTLVGGVATDGPFARGTAVSFKFTPTSDFMITPVAGGVVNIDGSVASVTPTWDSYVTVAEIPKPDPGEEKDVPTKFTVDTEALANRGVDTSKPAEVQAYLFGDPRANGQLGWVNVTLGIADNKVIATAPVEQVEDGVVLDFGLNDNDKAFYKITTGVSTVSNDAPEFAISDVKAENKGIVTVDVVVKDEGGTDHVIATKDVGVLEAGKDTTGAKEGTKTFDIVGVPWGSMDATAGTVSLDEILNKSLLTEGDKVYIKNGADYDTYTLTGGAWVKGATAKGRATLAAAETSPMLNKGDPLWIEHDVASRIVFSGAAVEQPANQTASKPDTEKSETEAWSLIANTSIQDLPLANITPAGAKDTIIVETIGAPIQYQYKDGAWGYWKTVKQDNGRNKLVWEPGGSIPAGTGFWYVNTGAADVTIAFPSNVDQSAD